MMLFRPVFGPELEAIFSFVDAKAAPVTREEIYEAFLPAFASGKKTSTQNIDDALTFLVSAKLLRSSDGFSRLVTAGHQPFQVLLLYQLRSLATGAEEATNELDPLYLYILEELFVKPDRLFVTDVHAAANGLREVAAMGGLSLEKLRSWARVMAFLGIGHRMGRGFQCVYAPDLLQVIIEMWKEEGFIQEFLEDHASQYLPFYTDAGSLTVVAEQSFLALTQKGILTMAARQDASSKPYFGEQRLRYLYRSTPGRESSG